VVSWPINNRASAEAILTFKSGLPALWHVKAPINMIVRSQLELKDEARAG
jgi:hypothetical protein